MLDNSTTLIRQNIVELKRKVSGTKKKIVIVTHWSPDGDAMGSSLGLFHVLKKLGHSVQVIVPNPFPEFLSWLPGSDTVWVSNADSSKKILKRLNEAEIVFCLDFNVLKRIDHLGEWVEKSPAQKVLVDHHVQPDGFAHFVFHDVKASSTCELVYLLLDQLKLTAHVNSKVAQCLYTGIMTDTGSFRFPSTRPVTHEIAAALLRAGANHTLIHEHIYDTNTYGRLALMGFGLQKKLKVLDQYATGLISFSEAEQKKFGYQKGDTEGLVNYPLSIKGVRFSAFFAERDGVIKVSFRSKGDFDVNQFARKHFEGGGHVNAAGGISKQSLNQTIKKFNDLLPLYANQLVKAK